MNREEARKNAEVMIAFADGKEIEAKRLNPDSVWVIATAPLFDFSIAKYRVKPQPKLIPFTFEDRNLFMGKIVRFKKGLGFGNEYMVWSIVSCDKSFVWMGTNSAGYNYDVLLYKFEFDDGSPCGKFMEE